MKLASPIRRVTSIHYTRVSRTRGLVGLDRVNRVSNTCEQRLVPGKREGVQGSLDKPDTQFTVLLPAAQPRPKNQIIRGPLLPSLSPNFHLLGSYAHPDSYTAHTGNLMPHPSKAAIRGGRCHDCGRLHSTAPPLTFCIWYQASL